MQMFTISFIISKKIHLLISKLLEERVYEND